MAPTGRCNCAALPQHIDHGSAAAYCEVATESLKAACSRYQAMRLCRTKTPIIPKRHRHHQAITSSPRHDDVITGVHQQNVKYLWLHHRRDEPRRTLIFCKRVPGHIGTRTSRPRKIWPDLQNLEAGSFFIMTYWATPPWKSDISHKQNPQKTIGLTRYVSCWKKIKVVVVNPAMMTIGIECKYQYQKNSTCQMDMCSYCILCRPWRILLLKGMTYLTIVIFVTCGDRITSQCCFL